MLLEGMKAACAGRSRQSGDCSKRSAGNSPDSGDQQRHTAPDDGVMDRLACLPIPDDGGLSLVGDANGGEQAGGDTRFGENISHGGELSFPYLVGVVFDPTGLGKDLAELLLRDGDLRA